MKDIVIVGAGGFGREVYGYVNDCIRAGAQWQIKGFIDDNENSLANYSYPHKVIGRISDYAPQPNDAFILAVAVPKTKKIVVESLLARGAVFETMIHPTTVVGQNVKIGRGFVCCPFGLFTCDAEIGDYVIFNGSSGMGHDTKVGSWSTLSSKCSVNGHCELGEGVFFGTNVATVPGSKVGDWASVGINSFVVGKVKPGASVMGNPAVPLR